MPENNSNNTNIQHLNAINSQLQEAWEELRKIKEIVKQICRDNFIAEIIGKKRKYYYFALALLLNEEKQDSEKKNNLVNFAEEEKAPEKQLVALSRNTRKRRTLKSGREIKPKKGMKDFSLHLLKVQYRIFQIITGAGDRENKRFAEFLSDSRNYKWTTAAFCLVSNNNWEFFEKILENAYEEVQRLEKEKLQFEIFLNIEELYLHSHENKFFQVLKEIKERRELAEAKENFQQWWRFKLLKLSDKETQEIKDVKTQEQFAEVRQKIEAKRSPGMILGGIAFFFLIFFRWDKFWAWYQKPLDDEWGWDDNDNDEEEVITEKPTPAEKEIPQPKSWWERIKNWPLNNKVKTLSLLGIVGCLLRFMWWVKNNLL